MLSSTCFEHPSVNPQEELYVLSYGISFMLKIIIKGYMNCLSAKHKVHKMAIKV